MFRKNRRKTTIQTKLIYAVSKHTESTVDGITKYNKKIACHMYEDCMWSTPALTDLVDDDVAAAHPGEENRSGQTQQEVVHATTQSPTMYGHNHWIK